MVLARFCAVGGIGRRGTRAGGDSGESEGKPSAVGTMDREKREFGERFMSSVGRWEPTSPAPSVFASCFGASGGSFVICISTTVTMGGGRHGAERFESACTFCGSESNAMGVDDGATPRIQESCHSSVGIRCRCTNISVGGKAGMITPALSLWRYKRAESGLMEETMERSSFSSPSCSERKGFSSNIIEKQGIFSFAAGGNEQSAGDGMDGKSSEIES